MSRPKEVDGIPVDDITWAEAQKHKIESEKQAYKEGGFLLNDINAVKFIRIFRKEIIEKNLKENSEE